MFGSRLGTGNAYRVEGFFPLSSALPCTPRTSPGESAVGQAPPTHPLLKGRPPGGAAEGRTLSHSSRRVQSRTVCTLLTTGLNQSLLNERMTFRLAEIRKPPAVEAAAPQEV